MKKTHFLRAALALLAAAALATSAEAATLNFSVMQSGTYDKAAEQLAPVFRQRTGDTLKIAAFPWAVLRQNNTTDLLTGANQYQAMSGGYYLADVYDYFLPLTPFISKDDYANGMIPGLMQPGRSEWSDGQQIGVPYGIDAYGLMVNTDVLGKAGVEPTFHSWSDVIAACEKIAKSSPDIACLSHSTGNPEQIGAFFFSAYDGGYVSKDGKYQLDQAKAVAAAALLPKLWRFLPRNGAALSFDEAGALFRDGKAAMLIDWPSFVSNSLNADASAVHGHWRQVTYPGPGFPWLSLWQMFVPKTAADPALAWSWIKIFAGPEFAKQNFVQHNIGSVWLTVYDDPALKAQHANQWPAQVPDFSRAKNPPLSGESQDFLTNTLQDVANGRVSPEQGIRNVNEKWATLAVPPALLGAAKASGLAAQ